MNTHTSIAIYDPHRLNPDDFLAGFVAREELADFLLNMLRKTPSESAAEHRLIIGQRGMGKTSLLRRLAIGITRDPGLAKRYIPLTFREEQYNVRSLDQFWRNCGESLAEWCDFQGKAEIATDLDRRLVGPTWRDARTAAEAFLGEASALGGRPVLFVDNLDLIVDELPMGEHWALRRTLQTPGGPILYGAATQFLSQSGDQNAAFYEFFHPHLLEPLSEDELLRCMHRLANARGNAGTVVQEILAREPERLRTLHTLTGGNPRVLALVYQLLERAESDAVFSDLEVLLDQLTPFYKARIEEYKPGLQRAVIDAIALHWDPITSHDLSKATTVEVTTISSQLDRLRKTGLVEEVPTSGARSGYQLVERFFNIWYLMRHGTRRTRQKMYWLTAFLKCFYAPDELSRMKIEADAAEPTNWHPLYREALSAAIESLSVSTRANFLDKSYYQSSDGKPIEVGVEPSDSHEDPLANIANLIATGFDLDKEGRGGEAIAIFDSIISRLEPASEPKLRMLSTSVIGAKALALEGLDREEEAIQLYKHALERFGLEVPPELNVIVATLLVRVGGLLCKLGLFDEAIKSYNEAAERFGGATEPALLRTVATALLDSGAAHFESGRKEEAIQIYNDIAVRFGDSRDITLHSKVAIALLNVGTSTFEMGRREEAVLAFDKIVEKFRVASDPLLRGVVDKALFNKGLTLKGLGRGSQAIEIFDDILERSQTASDPKLSELVAATLLNKGFVLSGQGSSEEALSIFDHIVKQFGTASEPEVLRSVAWSMLGKAISGQLGRVESVTAACDEIIARFAWAGASELKDPVALAFQLKGDSLRDIGQYLEAGEAYRRATEFAPHRRQVWISLGNILADHLGRAEEAEVAYIEATRDPDSTLIAKANLAWLFIKLGRLSETLALCKEIAALDSVGLSLISAALELTADNFGAATKYLSDAILNKSNVLMSIYFDDLLRFLRLAKVRGFGEKLLTWFDESGYTERQAPVHAAFVAFVRGKRSLLDFNPEVRKTAERIYDWLTSHGTNSLSATSGRTPKSKPRRGRPPKRSST